MTNFFIVFPRLLYVPGFLIFTNMAELIITTKEEMQGMLSKFLDDIEKRIPKSSIDEILTIEDVCNMLKVTEGTIYNYINKGKLPVYGFGGKKFFKKSEVINSLIKIEK